MTEQPGRLSASARIPAAVSLSSPKKRSTDARDRPLSSRKVPSPSSSMIWRLAAEEKPRAERSNLRLPSSLRSLTGSSLSVLVTSVSKASSVCLARFTSCRISTYSLSRVWSSATLPWRLLTEPSLLNFSSRGISAAIRVLAQSVYWYCTTGQSNLRLHQGHHSLNVGASSSSSIIAVTALIDDEDEARTVNEIGR